MRKKVQVSPDEETTPGEAEVITFPPGVVTSRKRDASLRFQPAIAVISSSPKMGNGTGVPGEVSAGRSNSGSNRTPFSKMLPKALEKNFSSDSPLLARV
jgi:hypothetical protein